MFHHAIPCTWEVECRNRLRILIFVLLACSVMLFGMLQKMVSAACIDMQEAACCT